MLPTDTREKFISNVCFYFFFFLLAWGSSPVFAQTTVTTVSASDMLANIATAIPNLMRLITAIAYVMGMLFIIRGVMELKHVGEMRTQMSHEHHIGGPIAMITVGALLLYLPSSVQVGMSSFWVNPNPYGYVESQDQWTQLLSICFNVVQFIGTLAFIRGLIILSHVGAGHGGQHGGAAKALTHIIGGIFCINIYQFMQVVFATLGISYS